MKRFFVFLQRYFLFLFSVSTLLLWLFVVTPELTKLPYDFTFSSDVISVDNFYDEERDVYTGEIYSRTEYKYETISSNEDISIIKNLFRVSTPEGDPIFAVEREYGIDRSSKAHVVLPSTKEREGFLFAPPHLKEGDSFVYWHINYDAPALMQFVKSEELFGLDVYHYETHYEGVHIDQTQNLLHLPEVGVTRGVEVEPYLEIWVEPQTGRLVKYADNTVAYYYDLETKDRIVPWNHFSNELDDASVAKNVVMANFEKAKLRLIEVYIPVVLVSVAVFALFRASSILLFLSSFITLKRFVLVVGMALIALAVGTLLMWSFGVGASIYVMSYTDAINPITAVCYFVLGVGILFRASSKPMPLVVFVCALFLVCISLIRIASVLEIITWQIDLILFRDTILSYPVLARMGFYTAISFLLLGVALGTSTVSKLRKLHMTEIISSVSVVLTLFAIFDFLSEGFNSFSLPLFYSVSVYTAVSFLLAGVVIYLYFRERDEYTLPFLSWAGVSSVLFILLLVTVVLTGLLERDIVTSAQSQFNAEISRTTSAIENRLDVYINALESGEGLFVASNEVDRSEWKRYVDSIDLQSNYPGIQGMGYAVFITPEEKEAHEQSVRKEGFPDYRIRPEGDRDLYTSIIYLEPFDLRNREAFGFDMYSNEIRRSAMEQARDTGEPKMSGAITLVQEIDDDVQAGFLIYVPFYKGEKSDELTLLERRESIVGYVYSPFRAVDFVRGVLGNDGIEDISLRIVDGTKQSNETVLYDDAAEKLGGLVGGDSFVATETIYAGGRPWKLTYTSKSYYGQGLFNRYLPLVSMLIGVGVSMLVTLIFYILISSRQRAVVAVENATKELREASARDEAILENIAEGLVVIDKKGKFLIFNDRAKEMLGKGPVTSGMNTWPKEYGMHDPKTGKLINMQNFSGVKALEGESVIGEELLIRNKKHSEDLFIRINASPVRMYGGSIAGVVFTFVDVSKDKEVDRAKSEFVSLASHQLRTPTTSINWYAELLRESGKLNKEHEEYVVEIESAAKRMTELINALLDVSRLELGTIMINPKKSDIVKIVSGAVKEQKQDFKKKKQVFAFTHDEDIPAVSVDSQITHMIVQNLLSNAHKYTPEKGKIRLHVAVSKERGSSGYVSIVCEDNGYGIPKSEQKDVFKKLQRADNVKKLDVEGTGLGLYVVKSVIESSGSRITFTSEENKGTRFEVQIPLSGMKKIDGGKKLSSTN